MGRPTSRQQIELVAADLRRAATEAGVDLPLSYARRVAADGLTEGAKLGVTRLGAGVVIHTAAEAKDRLPVLIGYADGRGQWHRDGRRHVEAPSVEGPEDAMEVGL